MVTRTNTKGRLPNRHVTDGRDCAPLRSCDAAVIALALQPRDTITQKTLEKAASAIRGSINAAQHLPETADECAIKFDLFDVAEIFKKTPCIAGLKPGGRYVAKDIYDAGVIPLLAKTLLDHDCLHGDCITVPGRVKAVNLQGVKRKSARQVGPAVNGAMTHRGRAQEKCYANT